MLAEQYRQFMEATTGAALPPPSTTVRHSELRRSTVHGGESERRAEMFQALATAPDSHDFRDPYDHYGYEPLDQASAAALQICGAAVLSAAASAFPARPVAAPAWGWPGEQLLEDALQFSAENNIQNLILERMRVVSRAPNMESANSYSMRSAFSTGRSFFEATLPPLPCW
mmetsp:Transcript_5637/g.12993  ORF Transcript_5637/g.12993 Transcript_5637/m.12993 type:complete len:171 (-) Transcript_5637:67-579(-)